MTKTEVAKQTAKISQVFPKFPKGMINILRERFIENNFSDARLIAAVNHVIDNYQGWNKLPNIADFISYDKKMRIFHFQDACNFGMSYLKMIDIGVDTPRWAFEEDVKRYNIKEWVPNVHGIKPVPKVNVFRLQESNREDKRKNFEKEVDEMFAVEPVKVKRKKFTRQEQKDRLEKFNEEHGLN